MLGKSRIVWFAALILLIQAAVICGPAPPATAARVDVGIFYEPLSTHGTWVDYGNYGPCWYPSGVGADWRPYLNGRWVPTAAGWIFETNEPWGWAGYHYGNWMPTADYGWVWCPGSTWYPSTCAWRSSPEYFGWAPIPPPGYGALADPFWVFAEAASFLLGFGQPYAPSYSYSGCGCLAPVDYVPTLYPRTVLLSDFYAPAYAPSAYYSFGPPFATVARVTNVNVVQINNYVKTVNIVNVQNAVPPQAVVQSHPVIRQVVPAPVLQGQQFAVKRASVGMSQVSRPNVLPPPRNVPAVKAEIPKAEVKRPAPGAAGKGLGLPHQAVKPTAPAVKPAPAPAPGAPRPAAPGAKPEAPAVRPPAEVKPAPPRPAAPARPEVRPTPPAERRAPPPGEVRPTPAPAPREVRPEVRPPAHEVTPAPARPVTPPREETRPAPARPVTPTPSPEVRPAPAPREVRPAPAPAPAPAPREMRPAPAPAPAPPTTHAPAPAPAPRAAPPPAAPHPPAAPAPAPKGEEKKPEGAR